MPDELDRLKRRLFDRGQIDVARVGLFPGSGEDVRTESVAAEMNKALDQIETGNCALLEDDD